MHLFRLLSTCTTPMYQNSSKNIGLFTLSFLATATCNIIYHHHLLHLIFAQVSEEISVTGYIFIGMLHDMLVLSRHYIIICINKHTVCIDSLYYNTIIYYKAVVYSTLQIYMELMVEILTSLELKLAIFFNTFSIWSQYFLNMFSIF